MPITVSPAVAADVPAIQRLHDLAFADDLYCTRVLPYISYGVVSAECHQWRTKSMIAMLDNPNQHIIKAVDDVTGKVVAFADYIDGSAKTGPIPSVGEKPTADTKDEVPPVADVQLWREMREKKQATKEALLKGREIWHLVGLATHPAYQGQGAASKLLQWGIEKAEQAGLDLYLEGSPMATPLYQKHGYEKIGEIFF